MPGLIAGALSGLGLGIVNGIVIDRTRINSFIGTLATSIIYCGLATVITGGYPMTVSNPSFGTLGQDEFFGDHLLGLVSRIRSRSCDGSCSAGRSSGATSTPSAATPRRRASRASGSASSGLLLRDLAASRPGSPASCSPRARRARPNLGTGLELTAISAAVVGGTSILGGEGAIWRAVLGTLLLAIIGNGFNLLNIDTTYQQIVQGGLILLAVAIDSFARRNSS